MHRTPRHRSPLRALALVAAVLALLAGAAAPGGAASTPGDVEAPAPLEATGGPSARSGPPDGPQIGAGNSHTCGIHADGTLTCWGNNDSSKAIPHAGIFTEIGGGASHTCGLRADGTLSLDPPVR